MNKAASVIVPDPPKKVILVTGATRGLGLEICRYLRRKSSSIYVILTGRDKHLGPIRVQKELNMALHAQPPEVQAQRKAKFNMEFQYMDVKKPETIKEVAKYLKFKFDGIDGLINNAGVKYRGFFDENVARDCIDTNFFGTYHTCNIMDPILLPGARVVNVAALEAAKNVVLPPISQELMPKHGHISMDKLKKLMNRFVEDTSNGQAFDYGWGEDAYAVSKLGVALLTPILSQKWKDRHILVNTIAPPPLRTQMRNRNISRKNLLMPEIAARWTGLLSVLPPDSTTTGKFFVGPKEVEFSKHTFEYVYYPPFQDLKRPPPDNVVERVKTVIRKLEQGETLAPPTPPS